MMSMLNWFLELFTLANLGYFMLGVASACAWHVIKAKFQHRIVVIRWQYIAIPVMVGLAAYMAAESQQNADCTREFNQAIRDSRAITGANDHLSIRHRQKSSEKGRAETKMWIMVLRPPDPDMAARDFSDPVRQLWARSVVNDYAREAGKLDAEILAIEKEQRELVDSRPPLPEPRCGR